VAKKAGRKRTTDERRARVIRSLGADLAKAVSNSFASPALISREIADRASPALISREIADRAIAFPGRKPQANLEAGGFSSTKIWVISEVGRMKAAGEIPEGIRITNFAKQLEARMRKAAENDKSLRPAGWRHIKNQLPSWNLWPIK
jgi:hypothetical protein